MKKHIGHHSITVVAVLAILAAGAGVFVYSGLYNIGADDHHTRPVFALLQTLRDRSIRMRSRDITVPDLQDPQRILQGAGQYFTCRGGIFIYQNGKASMLKIARIGSKIISTRFMCAFSVNDELALG